MPVYVQGIFRHHFQQGDWPFQCLGLRVEVLQALDFSVKKNPAFRAACTNGAPVQHRAIAPLRHGPPRLSAESSGSANSSNVCILFAVLNYSVNGSVRPTQHATLSAAERGQTV